MTALPRRKMIDPTHVATPRSRWKGRPRSSDYGKAETLGILAVSLLVLCLVAMAALRLINGLLLWP